LTPNPIHHKMWYVLWYGRWLKANILLMR